MLLRPELQTLRGDPAPQRAAQLAMRAVMERRRAESLGRAIDEELGRFAQGAELDSLPALGQLLGDATAAQAFVAELLADYGATLGAHPLAHVPLRHFTDGCTSTLLIAGAGPATLALRVTDGSRLRHRSPPTSASFVPCETWDCVLGGTARGSRVGRKGDRPGGAVLEHLPLLLEPGDRLARSGADETLVFDRVDGCLVVLRLQRRQTGVPTREYALSDGSLLHQAAGDPADSRLELITALLGRMGRRDAAPLLAAMAREQGATALRWQALRESLALDTAQGFAALCRIAVQADDPLAAPAGALRAQLIEAHPLLKEFAPCPV